MTMPRRSTSLHVLFDARGVLTVLILGMMACSRSHEEGGEVSAETGGDDPIVALRSQTATTRYGAVYWANVARQDTSLWAKAKAYCYSDEGWRAPNCGAVRNVESTNRMAAPPQKRPETRVRF
jgi:hypothetical protein